MLTKRGTLILVLILILANVACLLPATASPPKVHVVQQGDTPESIVAQYGITVADLVAWNKDRYPSLAEDPDLIVVGWELIVSNPKGTSPAMGWPVLPTLAPVQTPVRPSVQFDVAACEQAVIDLVNAERTKAGLPALVRDETLMGIARERSEDMAKRGYYSHYDPVTGEPVVDKLLRQKFPGYSGVAAENIACSLRPTSQTAQINVQGWLDSTGHRKNIMNSVYRRTGVGCAVSSAGKVYLTQVFTD